MTFQRFALGHRFDGRADVGHLAKKLLGLVGLLSLAACQTAPTFDLQGHRGARGHAPENTITAFDRALAIGVSTLELDTGITQDGVVVIGHDPRLNPLIARNAQGQWIEGQGPAVNALSLAQLQTYDVGRIKPGTTYAQTFAAQTPSDGERMPTLAALFERVKALKADHVRFDIETKLTPTDPTATREPVAFVQALLAVIQQHGMQDRVQIQSFDWRTLKEVQRLAPRMQTVCLTVQRNFNNVADPLWTAGLKLADFGGSVPRMVKAAGCTHWSPNFNDVDEAKLLEARGLGLRTVPWTVNTPEDIARLMALPIDGLISDYPDRVRSAMQTKGLPLPPTITTQKPTSALRQ
jgi:glycerophosphoryl diester phosphodiesterase